jgi:superfamily II DNA/RNA helicase
MKAVAIHGDKSQQERMAALDAFKKNEIDILVATDVAARGLDISDLPCVINYDLPYNAEDYVHRIGRTGRAGASGDAISIYSDKDERLLADIEKLIKQTIKRAEPEGFSRAPLRRARRTPSAPHGRPGPRPGRPLGRPRAAYHGRRTAPRQG